VWASEPDHIRLLLYSKEFYHADSPTFHKLKELASSFPVRQLLPDYKRFIYNCPLSDDEKEGLFNGSMVLSKKGDRIIQIYTSAANWYCTRINLLLALDHLTGEYATYTHLLNECIIHQFPKWSNKVYRGALHSPLEIFSFAFKHRFFIPSFVSTSKDYNSYFWDPWVSGSDKKGLQNVTFEIDLSEAYERSTVIQRHQTLYNQEQEVLLASYNLFEWVGYEWRDKRPIIKLKVLPYQGNVEEVEEDGKRVVYVNGNRADFPDAFIAKRGTTITMREMEPSDFTLEFRKLVCNYIRVHKRDNLPDLPWLNAPGLDSHLKDAYMNAEKEWQRSEARKKK
jgi:hypothetical protein